MRKLAPARVSHWDDFLISYRVYMMTGSFHILLFNGTFHVDKIHVWFKIANITHALPVPVYRQTDFTPTGLNNVYACAISHGSRWRQQPGHHKKPRKNGNYKFPSTSRAMTSSNRLRRPCRVSPARVRLIPSKPTHWALHLPKEQ